MSWAHLDSTLKWSFKGSFPNLTSSAHQSTKPIRDLTYAIFRYPNILSIKIGDGGVGASCRGHSSFQGCSCSDVFSPVWLGTDSIANGCTLHGSLLSVCCLKKCYDISMEFGGRLGLQANEHIQEYIWTQQRGGVAVSGEKSAEKFTTFGQKRGHFCFSLWIKMGASGWAVTPQRLYVCCPPLLMDTANRLHLICMIVPAKIKTPLLKRGMFWTFS